MRHLFDNPLALADVVLVRQVNERAIDLGTLTFVKGMQDLKMLFREVNQKRGANHTYGDVNQRNMCTNTPYDDSCRRQSVKNKS
jgi:hypothetical protein